MARSARRQPELKNRALSPKQLNFSHFLTGKAGETTAKNWLIQRGYKILETNLAYKWYEVDLVVFDPSRREIVFVEVKTRTNAWFGHPSLAVNKQKLSSLYHAANQYLRIKGLRNHFRFDIISVTPQGVEHFENISWP